MTMCSSNAKSLLLSIHRPGNWDQWCLSILAWFLTIRKCTKPSTILKGYAMENWEIEARFSSLVSEQIARVGKEDTDSLALANSSRKQWSWKWIISSQICVRIDIQVRIEIWCFWSDPLIRTSEPKGESSSSMPSWAPRINLSKHLKAMKCSS